VPPSGGTGPVAPRAGETHNQRHDPQPDDHRRSHVLARRDRGPGRSELSFRAGIHEIGHLHGDHALHLAFPKRIWADLHEQGRITYHPVFPDKPGPASRRIEDDDDVREVIALLRLNYDRIVARYGLPEVAPSAA
jgi:hypothetical protein